MLLLPTTKTEAICICFRSFCSFGTSNITVVVGSFPESNTTRCSYKGFVVYEQIIVIFNYKLLRTVTHPQNASSACNLQIQHKRPQSHMSTRTQNEASWCAFLFTSSYNDCCALLTTVWHSRCQVSHHLSKQGSKAQRWVRWTDRLLYCHCNTQTCTMKLCIPHPNIYSTNRIRHREDRTAGLSIVMRLTDKGLLHCLPW